MSNLGFSIFLVLILSGAILVVILILSGITYYALKTRKQGFLVLKTKKVIRHSTIQHIDDNIVTFHPSGPDKYLANLPTVGLFGNSGNLIMAGPSLKEHDLVTRHIVSKNGMLEIGDKVNVDLFVYQSNPKEGLDIDYSEVEFTSELGNLCAWYIPADSTNWIIGIHGHRSSRRESLRYTRTLKNLNLNQLYITYRNDKDINNQAKSYHMFGLTEWKDLEAAVNYVKGNSPLNIFFLGHSMGGAIAFNFLLKSKISDQIAGVILESPVLDLNRIISHQAGTLPFPAKIFLNPVKFLVSKFVGINWSDLDYLSKSHEIRTPILLIHSENDETVPVSTGDHLANNIPGLVDYLRLKGAPHAGAWNYAQDKVEHSVTKFLNKLT